MLLILAYPKSHIQQRSQPMPDGGVEHVPWIDYYLVYSFFDKYYVATIPKSKASDLR